MTQRLIVFSVPAVADSPKPASSRESSFLSDAIDGDMEPPTKRRRVSFSESSLSSEGNSSVDSEEGPPLAAKRAERVGKNKGAPKHSGKGKKTGGPPRNRGQRTGGKSMSSMKSKAQTAPASKPPPTDQERADMTRSSPGETNGHDYSVKVEDAMDASQLTRLVTGVTVDAGGAASATTVSVRISRPYS